MKWNDLFDELKKDAAALWAGVEAAAINIAHQAEEEVVASLANYKDLAIKTVFDLATAEFQHMTGQEKREHATAVILNAASKDGKTIAFKHAEAFVQDAYDALATTRPAG